jgi:hypothetical protein
MEVSEEKLAPVITKCYGSAIPFSSLSRYPSRRNMYSWSGDQNLFELNSSSNLLFLSFPNPRMKSIQKGSKYVI